MPFGPPGRLRVGKESRRHEEDRRRARDRGRGHDGHGRDRMTRHADGQAHRNDGFHRGRRLNGDAHEM